MISLRYSWIISIVTICFGWKYRTPRTLPSTCQPSLSPSQVRALLHGEAEVERHAATGSNLCYLVHRKLPCPIFPSFLFFYSPNYLSVSGLSNFWATGSLMPCRLQTLGSHPLESACHTGAPTQAYPSLLVCVQSHPPPTGHAVQAAQLLSFLYTQHGSFPGHHV